MSHWKTLFDYKHLGCHDLPTDANGKALDLVVTMISLEKREVITEGGRKEMLPVAELKGAAKPMIMNKTNLERLANLFDTTDYTKYPGKTFTLYADRVKGKKGGIVDGLRVRDKLPVIKLPEFNPEHPRWAGAKAAIEAGETTVEAIRKNFTVSPENEKLLNQKS